MASKLQFGKRCGEKRERGRWEFRQIRRLTEEFLSIREFRKRKRVADQVQARWMVQPQHLKEKVREREKE